MTFNLTIADGTFLVGLARQTVTEYLKSGKVLKVPNDISDKLMKKCGVFVTLNSVSRGAKMLRGCIGLPYPTTPLTKAVIEAAVSSSTQDPRFPPLSMQELDSIVFEISVLTPPERVIVRNPLEYISKIKVGKDGLIMENGYNKGLLLPQVPVELNWNEEEFLSQTAMKAGLLPDAWLLENTKIYRFQAIIFEEEIPKGNVKQKKI
ncbi:TIGR00296 family protein [Candidatus Bathyarchaeota archaeon]|nr:TIGR00296 family protein [Candidatus Bathyarchaeota archaeon]